MPTVRLRGINQVKTRLATGKTVTYYYAWKGGPRLEGKPGSPEFVASFARAAASRTTAQQGGTLLSLINRYRVSPEFGRLADSTRKEWGRWLDRISLASIASLPIGALNDPSVKSDLLDWRDTYADRPRTADYSFQVLSRVLGWSQRRGLLKLNAAANAETLHRSDRADKIWTPREIESFAAAASPEVARALRLACATGLRRGDLIALQWADISDTGIHVRTQKTGKTASIPFVPESRAVLAEIGRRDGHVLLNTVGRPWTASGIEGMIIKAKAKAGVQKRLHDARGTFATRLRIAGYTGPQIADVMGWEEDRVSSLLSVYVDRETVVRQLSPENESATKTPKRTPKRSATPLGK